MECRSRSVTNVCVCVGEPVCVCWVPSVDFPREHVSDVGRIPPVPELSAEIINGFCDRKRKGHKRKIG